MSLYLSPQFKYMTFYLHHLLVYYKLTTRPVPSWLDSSVSRALHQYHRGFGFESRSSLNFFQALSNMINHVFINSYVDWNMEQKKYNSTCGGHLSQLLEGSFTNLLRVVILFLLLVNLKQFKKVQICRQEEWPHLQQETVLSMESQPQP